uniref:Uncharacterized protein n=1 Tax=viral metagenome TaxID=1070528 RepID=A0A6M3L4A3_9ZZZZ
MNDIQKRVVENLKKDILNHDSMGFPEYEYKEWKIEVETIERTYPKKKSIPHVYIFCTVGKVGDEDTMASIFCRTRRLMVIGPRGAVKGLLGRKQSGYHKALIWSKES